MNFEAMYNSEVISDEVAAELNTKMINDGLLPDNQEFYSDEKSDDSYDDWYEQYIADIMFDIRDEMPNIKPTRFGTRKSKSMTYLKNRPVAQTIKKINRSSKNA